MKRSEAFEQQIQRIHELLEGADARITWNDHFPDPDNPAQMRQSDVTIRRGDHLTLVECRDHEHPQDVQWIEELIGRRQSLGAHAVVAVSSSGFTKGAVAKALKHAVALRDVSQLTDADVKLWGRSVSLTLYYYQYAAPTLVLGFSESAAPSLDVEAIRSELSSSGRLQALFSAVAEVLTGQLEPREEHEGRTVRFDVNVDPDGFSLCGQPVRMVRFHGTAGLLRQDAKVPVVVGYGEPGPDNRSHLAVVEQFDVGETSIVHDGNRIALLVDISTVQMPPLCQFRFVAVHSEDELEHEQFSLIGLDKLSVRAGAIDVVLLLEQSNGGA